MREHLNLSEAINIVIPWADTQKPKQYPEGARAIVPEIDMYGRETGNMVNLDPEQYRHELGGAALSSQEVELGLTKRISYPHPEVSTHGRVVPDAPPPLESYHGQILLESDSAYSVAGSKFHTKDEQQEAVNELNAIHQAHDELERRSDLGHYTRRRNGILTSSVDMSPSRTQMHAESDERSIELKGEYDD